MIDHSKASTTRNQVDINNNNNNATSSSDLKTSVTKPANNADVSASFKYSIKSLSSSTNKNNRCVVCYKLLHTWKGSRLCRYYDINSEIRGGLGSGKRRQRQASNNNSTPENLSKSCDVQIKAVKPEIVEPAATAAVEVQTVGGRLRSNNKKPSTTAAENNKNGNNASEDGAGAKRNSSKADDSSNADVVNLVNGGSEVNHHGDSNNNNNSLVSSLSSSNHKASSNSNFSSNNKFTIGDLISKTLSLKSSAVVQLSGDESKAATLLQAGGKICDCCLDNISLIDYHANHSSQLKAKMMRKFKFASKFHSNRFTLNRNRNRKCLAKRLRGAKRSSSTTNNSFLSTNRRLNGLLNGYNKRVYHLSSESDSSKRTYHRRPQIDHDKIDKLNSLLENVSLAIASAILNNPKAGKLPETRNGLVADDHLNQERQPTMAAKSGGAKSSSSSSASASGVIRNHHQNHNQPRIIESNELINNLNKLGQQQQQQQSSSTNNNNSLSRNRTVTNTSSHPVVKMPETNVLLNLLALVKSHQDAMNNGGAGSGQAGLKFNGLNQNLITNGLQLFNHHQDQFGDQQHQSHSSSSLSPQETNRRKRKSINPSRLPKLGKFDEPFSKLQDQKGGEEENEDDENESEEDNDEDGGHETTADIKPSKESQQGSLMGGQKKTFNNKSTKQQQVLAAGGKNNKAFQKPPATINNKSANARKGFSLAKAENGHGGAYNENVLDEADENFNGNEYVADDEDQDQDQDGGAGDHEDGDEALFNQHDLTSDSHHFENEDEDVENHEGDQNNHDDSAVYQNGGQNNFDDYNDENDDEAELDHQNDNSQEYPEDDEDDENLADGAETMAYDDNNNNFADGGGAGGLLYNEHEHEVNNNDNEEHHLNTEIRKINSKPTSSRPSKTVANAKFSATKQIPAQQNAAKPPATAVLQKTNNNNMTGGKKTTNLNSTFKPIASPAAIVGAALKAGGARVQVVNNNQNRVKSEAANNLNNKNGNNRPAAAAVTTVANNNKNKPTIQNAAKNLNNLARNNNQANNLKVAGAKQAAAAAVDVKKPFKSNLNNVNTIAPAKKQPVKTVAQTNHVGTNLRQNRAAIPNKLVAVAKNEMKEEEEEYELDNEDLILNQDLDEENNEMFDENDDQYDGGQVGDDEDPEGEEFFGSQSPSVSPSPSHSSSVIRQNGFNGTGSSQGGNHHERSGSGKNNSAGSSSSNMKHVCQICNKTFKTQNILRQHMRIHTGDKPFVCDLCSKAFSQMASLKYHLATHSDDRPFKCENCSKTFKLKPPFKKHIKECPPRHHGSSNSLYSQSNHNMSGVGVNQDFNDDE